MEETKRKKVVYKDAMDELVMGVELKSQVESNEPVIDKKLARRNVEYGEGSDRLYGGLKPYDKTVRGLQFLMGKPRRYGGMKKREENYEPDWRYN